MRCYRKEASMQKIALRTSLLSVLMLTPGAAEASDEDGPSLKCERITFDVSLAANQPADQHLVGTLCARGSLQHKTIQVLIHGGTYDHNYWDFPYQPETYSYVRELTNAGYATLNIDRLGVGESSRPVPGSSLTLHTAAF